MVYQLEMNGHQCGVRDAYVYEDKDYAILKSYWTIVAYINKKTNKVYVRDWYSTTTSRHLNSFLRHFGKKPIYKNDYQKYEYNRSWKNVEKKAFDIECSRH